MLTAYDFPMASFIDQAGVDMVLVSDAVGTVGNGRPEAVSVTVDEMIYHTRAVRNGARHSMVVTTLPFGSYNGLDDAVHNATRLMKEGGADGVHLEGTRQARQPGAGHRERRHPGDGPHWASPNRRSSSAGRIKLPGRGRRLGPRDHRLTRWRWHAAGVFALVVECLPAALAEIITRSLDIPTIGIGSGIDCDGQALVTQDMLGLYKEMSPRFLKVYADLTQTSS